MIDTQDEAYEILQRGDNVFIGSSAGTGKSWLINQFRSGTNRKIAVTASTGIAAYNIGGQTIFSYLGIGLGPKLEYGEYESIKSFVDRVTSTEYYFDQIHQKLLDLEILVIDEISMISGVLLDYIDAMLREVRCDDHPFGGLQIVMLGDFYQLPVVTKWGRKVDWAFHSHIWDKCNFTNVLLKKIYRQTDPEFQNILNRIRTGDINSTINDTMRARIVEDEEDIDGSNCVIIETHNKEVDANNERKLQDLVGEIKTYVAQCSGPGAEVKALKQSTLSPEELNLKVGAKVMCTCNTKEFINGTLAYVTELGKDHIKIKLEDGSVCLLARNIWDNDHYATRELRATFSQFPLKLAYSLTVFKTQSLTLSNVYYNPMNAFGSGMSYVAISRVQSLEGLFLKNWRMGCVKSDKIVKQFYGSLE